MGRKRVTVKMLAKMGNLSVDDTQLMLMDADIIDVLNENIIIPKSKYKKALNILKIIDKTERNQLEISVISKEAGIKENELCSILCNDGIISKRCKKRIPSNSLSKVCKLIKDYTSDKVRKVLPVLEPKTKKTKTKWTVIGPEEELIYLHAKDVIEIHNVLVRDFKSSKDPIEPPGVKSYDLLESAMFRPKTSLGSSNKYPSVAMAGAALLHALIHNHPFHNGNKRTALVSLIVFLDKNGWVLTIGQDELYEYLLDLAAHNLKLSKTNEPVERPDDESLHIAGWIQRNMKRIRHGEYPLQFRQLKQILSTYGCEFHYTKGNKLKIIHGKNQTVITYFGDGREVRPEAIYGLRKNLQLDEEHGYDTDIFYNKTERIPEFITKYRKVLDRLGKV